MIAIFDGDYVAATVAIGELDPLQNAVDLMFRNFVENPWLSRRLPKTLQSLGFELETFRGHSYTLVSDPSYMLTIIERGADLLYTAGTISIHQAEALKSEAERRAADGEFFGQIPFVSAVARRI